MGPLMALSWQLGGGPAGSALPSLAAVCEKALLLQSPESGVVCSPLWNVHTG